MQPGLRPMRREVAFPGQLAWPLVRVVRKFRPGRGPVRPITFFPEFGKKCLVFPFFSKYTGLMMDFRTCQAPIAHRLPESLIAAASLCVIPAVKVELFRAVADIGERLERLSDVSEETRACGIFNSFDFHYAVGSPKLIEVNSNAGGAFVQAELDRSMWDTLDPNCRAAGAPAYDPSSMILDCWRQLRPGRFLADVAIIESFPEERPLFSDMKLAVRSLLERGIRARIATPESLQIHQGKLHDRYGQVDFAYNRLTDFEFSCDSSRALRNAWLEGLAIVAPNPNVHEGYANKKTLGRIGSLTAASCQLKRPCFGL